MDKDILEVVLKKCASDARICRIIDMRWELALKKGDNFTTTIYKVILKVVLGNGRISEKSFIVKKENVGETSNLSKDFFRIEASIYTNVLREMDCLLEEFRDTEGPLWCKLIFYNLSDPIIILEDLKACGFNTVKRSEAQDLEHARLVLRSLGRFHAMAKVLEERGLISGDDYKPFPFLYDNVYIRNIVYGAHLALVKGIRARWGDEWTETADKLSQMTFGEFSRRIQNSARFDDDTFKCLNHGDCWNNNMLFKHDWEERPIGLRLVDFQIPHYSSPCIDIIYFMYTSIKPEVRHQYYNTLIELYHRSLTSSLAKFGYKESKPSLKEMNDVMDRLLFFRISFFTGCFPIVVSTEPDAMDLDKVFKSNGIDGFNINAYGEDGIKEKLEEDVKILEKLHES